MFGGVGESKLELAGKTVSVIEPKGFVNIKDLTPKPPFDPQASKI